MRVTITGSNGKRPRSSNFPGLPMAFSITALTLSLFLAPDVLSQAPPPNTVSLYRVWSSELQDNMTVSLTPTLSENLQARPRGFPDKYADRTLEGFIFTPDPKNPSAEGHRPSDRMVQSVTDRQRDTSLAWNRSAGSDRSDPAGLYLAGLTGLRL